MSNISSFKSWKNELRLVENIKGYLVPGQEKALMVIASKLPQKSVVVEIGSYMGKSTACIALASPKSTKIYAVDTFRGNKKDFRENKQFIGGDFYEKFKQNLSKLGIWNKIVPQIGKSYGIGKKWKLPIDFLFIDGSHVYEDVKNDFELFYPFVKDGGIIALHDVSAGHPGVLKCWKENVTKKIRQYENVHTLYFGFKHPRANSGSDKARLAQIKNESTQKKVFVILPVFNRLKLTIKCLNSLVHQSYKNIEVVVIDDGSVDGTEKYIKNNYKGISIIKGDGGWFWTKSINKGIRNILPKAEAEDFILTMNNDCFFGREYVKTLVEYSQKSSRSIVGSLIVDPAHPKKVLDAGVAIDWKHAHIYGMSEKKPYVKDYKDIDPISTKIDTLPGKGTLIPIETFSKIGLFNQTLLPHYLADYEFFNRAKVKGIRITVSTNSILFNFSKQTGTTHQNLHHKAHYKQVFNILFSRKSKINILDHLFFLILRCPKKYLPINLLRWLLKLINYVLLIFPFFYIKEIVDFFKKVRRRFSEKH